MQNEREMRGKRVKTSENCCAQRPGRSDAQPLVLAATKSNIGHLEGSAGVAGISKVICAITKAT